MRLMRFKCRAVVRRLQTVVERKLHKSSGHKGWDEAVLKALDKTETFPRDTDGRVPSLMVLTFRPRD